jgi:hypothetical protein
LHNDNNKYAYRPFLYTQIDTKKSQTRFWTKEVRRVEKEDGRKLRGSIGNGDMERHK